MFVTSFFWFNRTSMVFKDGIDEFRARIEVLT